MADSKKPQLPKLMIDGKPVKGVLKYPRLNEADTKFKPTGEFSTKVVLDNATGKAVIAVLKPMHEAAFAKEKLILEEKLKEAKGESKGKLKKALEKLTIGELPVKPVFDDEGNETDQFEIAFKMNAKVKDRKSKVEGALKDMRPKFFDASGTAIPFEQAPSVWGGTVARVSGYVSSYYAAAANTAGASLRLSAVQILKLVTGGGGNKAEDHGFGKEDDEEGFKAGDAAPAAPAKPKAPAKQDGEDSGEAGEDEEF